MGHYGFDNKAASFRCGANVFAYFCDNTAATINECLNLKGSTSAGRISSPFMRSYIMSDLITVPYDEMEKPAITLFEHPNCMGTNAAFFAGAPNQDALYTSKLMTDGNMYDNAISSIKVPFGASVTLYTEDSFIGFPFVVDGYANNDIGKEATCVNLWNDVYSSFKVHFKPYGPAVGSWKNVGSGRGSITKNITVGATTTNEAASSKTKETFSSKTIPNTLNVSMNVGFAFDSEPLNDSLAAENIKAVKTVLAQATSASTPMNCDATKTRNPAETVSLWQWVVSSFDGSVSAATEHVVCKIGAGWDKPPLCPYGACNDANCTQCSAWALGQ